MQSRRAIMAHTLNRTGESMDIDIGISKKDRKSIADGLSKLLGSDHS